MAVKNGTPPFPVSALQLVPFDSVEDEFEQMWTVNHRQWGAPAGISKDIWVQAAKERAKLDYSTEGRYKTFMVTVKDDPSLPAIAFCGFYVRPAIVATRKPVAGKDGSTTSIETRVQDVLAATLGSVICREEYRGCGYGGWMVSQIWQYLLASPVQFTFLYSDIGLYYTRYGWKKHRSELIELIVNECNSPWIPSTTEASSETQLSWDPITDGNLNEVLDQDASHLRDELALKIEDSPEGTALFAVLPEPRSVAWHRSRENFYLSHLHFDHPHPSTSTDRYGVVLSTERSSSGSSLNTLRFITWVHEFRSNQLTIMRFRHGLDKDDNEAKREALLLLQEAFHEARRWRLGRVVIWNPHPTLCAWTGQQVQERTKGLANLGVCQSPNVAGQDRIPISNVEWILNEYYP
ncbi:hypothetical protein DFQ27_002532, partial [Actinomortierella ambigua]